MKIDKLQVGYLKTNCYFIIKDNDLIIVDPGDEYEKIKSKIKKYNIRAVFLTHDHFDHNGALEKLLSNYKVPVNPNSIQGFKYQIISTSGHTKDSVSFYFPDEELMFTGDFLFYQTIGRTDLSSGNNQDMQRSLAMIKKYSDNIVIYPGHGPKTVLGDEKLRFGSYSNSLA